MHADFSTNSAGWKRLCLLGGPHVYTPSMLPEACKIPTLHIQYQTMLDITVQLVSLLQGRDIAVPSSEELLSA